MERSNKSIAVMLLAEDGQTVILAVFCMSVLLGFLALAVDVGLLFHARRVAQTAADSGAIAGAEEINYGDVTEAAQADAARNGVSNGVQGASVTVNHPPASGPYAGNTAYVEVITSQPQPTYFMNVFGRSSVNVVGRAVATPTPVQNCIYTLNPTGTDMGLSGGADVQMPGCGIIDNSGSTTALQVTGNSTLTASTIGIVGGYSISNGSVINPNPSIAVSPTSDPLALLQPPAFSTSSCLPNPNYGGGVTYTVGSGGTMCFSGLSVAGGSTLTFNPGIYVINGTFSVSGGAALSGSGVTFYLPQGGSVSISGGGILNLKAPTSGPFNGILFYEDRSDTQSGLISGGANSTLQGIIYFPNAGLTLSGGTDSQTYASIIAGSLSFSGGTVLENYSIVNPATPLTAPRLVE